MGKAGSEFASDVLLGQVHAVSVVTRLLLVDELLLAYFIQPLGGAETAESISTIEQLLRMLLIDSRAFALPIRRMWASLVGAFIPIQMKPFQCSEDVILRLSGAAYLVSIFDTQNEFAAVLACKTQIEQSDVRSTNVGISGR